MRWLKTCLFLIFPLALMGCSTLAQRSSSGVVVARRAQIRSSTAVVAADLLQVNRGDQVDILDSTDVPDPNDNTRKERWLRVRAHDEDATEGWIESRNVMPEEVLEASKKLSAEDEGVPPLDPAAAAIADHVLAAEGDVYGTPALGAADEEMFGALRGGGRLEEEQEAEKGWAGHGGGRPFAGW